MVHNKNAIILCSGGLDSVVTAYYVKKILKYNNLTILFFDYGQRTLKQEKNAAKICAKNLKAEFKEIHLEELNKISTSMINSNKRANKLNRKDLKNMQKEGQKWYVPCRNTIFLVYALAIAESKFIKSREKHDIFIGFKNEGKESFPDTTKEFLEEINNLQKVIMGKNIQIFAPLIKMDKEDIIQLGVKLGIKFEKTYSCYIGVEKEHCGECLACKLRQEGFYWAGVKDFTIYANKITG